MSRDTSYRFESAFEVDGVDSLVDKDWRRPNVKNRAEEPIEQPVVEHAVEQPAHGQICTTNAPGR